MLRIIWLTLVAPVVGRLLWGVNVTNEGSVTTTSPFRTGVIRGVHRVGTSAFVFGETWDTEGRVQTLHRLSHSGSLSSILAGGAPGSVVNAMVPVTSGQWVLAADNGLWWWHGGTSLRALPVEGARGCSWSSIIPVQSAPGVWVASGSCDHRPTLAISCSLTQGFSVTGTACPAGVAFLSLRPRLSGVVTLLYVAASTASPSSLASPASEQWTVLLVDSVPGRRPRVLYADGTHDLQSVHIPGALMPTVLFADQPKLTCLGSTCTLSAVYEYATDTPSLAGRRYGVVLSSSDLLQWDTVPGTAGILEQPASVSAVCADQSFVYTAGSHLRIASAHGELARVALPTTLGGWYTDALDCTTRSVALHYHRCPPGHVQHGDSCTPDWGQLSLRLCDEWLAETCPLAFQRNDHRAGLQLREINTEEARCDCTASATTQARALIAGDRISELLWDAALPLIRPRTRPGTLAGTVLHRWGCTPYGSEHLECGLFKTGHARVYENLVDHALASCDQSRRVYDPAGLTDINQSWRACVGPVGEGWADPTILPDRVKEKILDKIKNEAPLQSGQSACSRVLSVLAQSTGCAYLEPEPADAVCSSSAMYLCVARAFGTAWIWPDELFDTRIEEHGIDALLQPSLCWVHALFPSLLSVP